MTRRLIPLRQAAEHWSWATERYPRRLVSERRIAFHKIGPKIYLDASDLDAYAESARVEAVAR
jgi:excisionase family DNA binding protein